MAWRLYSFARWPTENSPGKQKAYALALAAFQSFARHLDPPVETIRIPFEGKEIVGLLRLPKGGARPAPLLFSISALDSRKEEHIERGEVFLDRGIATLSFDMPGTGQAPIPGEPNAERMFSRVLDYVATRPEIDAKRVVLQGGSWSGYYAAKLGILEKDRLKAVVVQGGPIHQYFQRDWQMKALGTREYLFDLFAARASVYRAATLEDFLAFGPKMSLKEQGLIGKPSAPMLLVNGDHDTSGADRRPRHPAACRLAQGGLGQSGRRPYGPLGRLAGREDLPAGGGALDRPPIGQRGIACRWTLRPDSATCRGQWSPRDGARWRVGGLPHIHAFEHADRIELERYAACRFSSATTTSTRPSRR